MTTATQQTWNEGAARANAAYQGARRRYTIDPITRLEGHGKIDIFLNDSGNVERAYMQVPELRGFEVFSIGRPAEDMPQITSRICGVCPTAHHMAATKALDDLYQVQPTPAARKIRELVYNTFMLEDHALHVYVLGGPDFIVGPTAPAAQRNIVGVIGKVGVEVGKKVIGMRKRLREIIAYFGGKVIHPVLGQPGGVSKWLDPAELPKFKEVAKDGLDFALFTNQVFHDIVLKNPDYVKLIISEPGRADVLRHLRHGLLASRRSCTGCPGRRHRHGPVFPGRPCRPGRSGAGRAPASASAARGSVPGRSGLPAAGSDPGAARDAAGPVADAVVGLRPAGLPAHPSRV